MFNTKINMLKPFGEVIVIGYKRQSSCSPLYIYIYIYIYICVCVCVCVCVIKSVLLSQILLSKIVAGFACLKFCLFSLLLMGFK
jgi:hypothetical protein